MKKLLNYLAEKLTARHVLAALSLALFVLPLITQATDTASVTDTREEVQQTLAFTISIFVQTINSFLWPFLLLIGELMDNDLILGPGMEFRLLGIWSQMRNLVNIAFVLVLLVVAFYNVNGIGGGEGDFAIKTALPKIVIGLVLVNFTFMFGKVVLDLSNIGTNAAFALPEIIEDYDFEQEKSRFVDSVCYKKDGVIYDLAVDKESDIPIYTKMLCKKDGDKYLAELKDVVDANYFTKLNSNNISLIMAINMGALDEQHLLKAEAIDDFGDLTVNTIFSLVMYIVFAVSYIVLAMVLIARIIVMWLAMAFSPLAVIVYVVPQLKDLAGGGGGDLMNQLVKHLIAPMIIGLVMTVGYLMIAALDQTSAISGLADTSGDTLINENFFISGIDDMERLLIAIVSIAVVWTGIFMAASGTVASSVTDGIKSVGGRLANAAARAPLYAPIIPAFSKDGSAAPITPISALNLADSTLRHFEHGRPDDANLNKLLAERGFSSYNTEDVRKPGENLQSIRETLDNANPSTLTAGEFSSIVRALRPIINQSKSLSNSVKAKFDTELAKWKDPSNVDSSSLGALRTLLTQHADVLTADKLGVEASQLTPVLNRLKNETTTLEAPAAVTRAPAANNAATTPAPTALPAAPAGTLRTLDAALADRIRDMINGLPEAQRATRTTAVDGLQIGTLRGMSVADRERELQPVITDDALRTDILAALNAPTTP